MALTPLGGSTVQLDLEGSGAASGLGRLTLSYNAPASLNPTTTPHQLTTIGREATLVAQDGTRLTLAIFAAGTIDDAGTAFGAEVGGTLIGGTRRATRTRAGWQSAGSRRTWRRGRSPWSS